MQTAIPLRSTATNIGTYSFDMAKKIEVANDFKTERNELRLLPLYTTLELAAQWCESRPTSRRMGCAISLCHDTVV